MDCKYCNHKLSSKSALRFHQKSARYCLKKQGKNIEGSFCCALCGKKFQNKSHLNNHSGICNKNSPNLAKIVETNNILEKEIVSLKKEIEMVQKENKMLRKDKKDLNDTILQIATTSIIGDKKKIEALTRKYVKKQPRVQYDVCNVIYILTTASLKKDRRYILGKAGNLTNRLSTYNKTDEHDVVYFIGCGSKERMGLLEGLVFQKLEKYREQANRERFVLPEGETVDLFKLEIDKCLNFLGDGY